MASEAKAVQDEEQVYSSMEEILAGGATDVQYVTIEGFQPGKKIRIGSVTAGDIIDWTDANEGEAKKTAGLRLITKSIVDAKGMRIADDPKNIQKFRAMRHKDVDRIVREILKLNGIGTKEQEAVKKD